MKKSYGKPEAKKVSFQYTEAVVASGGSCDQGWTKRTTSNPSAGCDKCFAEELWIGSTDPFGP